MPPNNLPLILLVPKRLRNPRQLPPTTTPERSRLPDAYPGPYASPNPHRSIHSNARRRTSPPSATAVLLPLLDHQQHKDVVIIAHSYGAIIASGAAKGLDKPTREGDGRPGGGLSGLMYVAGNIVLDDESLGETLGGVYPPFIKLDKV